MFRKEGQRMNNKVLVVGTGIVGCVIAHELKKANYDVSMIERRDHTGGNLYDFTDEYGVHVHLYGPHIFHTKEKNIYDYVANLCELKDFNLVCGAVIDGVCVRTTFDFSSIDTFFPTEAEEIKAHLKSEFGEKTSATVLEMLDSNDAYVHKFAQFLYDNDYRPYTAKQWGIEPEKIDRQIFKRVPIMLSYGSRYFDDAYQAMPVKGYMELIENLISDVPVETGIEALDCLVIEKEKIYWNDEPFDGIVVYTGPIDELFRCEYGSLPYRSLRFEWKHEQIDSLQDMPVVAYPQEKDFTRITEYKKLPEQDVDGTTYAVEYPIPYAEGMKAEPYYPVLTDDSKQLYEKYRLKAEKIRGLYCAGRLADFKYYNIDQAIKRGLEVAEKIVREVK